MSKDATDFKFNRGDEVRDKITGFQGIITSRTDYINGCNRYGVQPKADKCKMVDAYNIDEQSLELVAELVHSAYKGKELVGAGRPGGPPTKVPR